MDIEFLKKFEECLKVNKIEYNDPNLFVDAWSEFVDECVKGYTWSLLEYWDELTIRDDIEIFLSCTELQKFDDFKKIQMGIRETDNIFEKLLVYSEIDRFKEEKYWRHRGILGHAGNDYVEDVEGLLGLKIEKD